MDILLFPSFIVLPAGKRVCDIMLLVLLGAASK